MSLSIDKVYKFVQFVSNKESRGWVSPEEFNLSAEVAQLVFYSELEGLYKQTKVVGAYLKPVVSYVDVSGGGVHDLPSDFRIPIVTYISTDEGDPYSYVEVREIDVSELPSIYKSSIVSPSADYPACYYKWGDGSSPVVVGDWYMPSRDELSAMYTNLHSSTLGGFSATGYWSSSDANNSIAIYIDFTDGSVNFADKSTQNNVRPIRSFTASIGDYAIGDTGTGGGLIFYVDGTTYYEAAPSDLSGTYAWDSVTKTHVITESLVPSLIRNVEGDNVSESSTTTLLEITSIDGNEITLGNLTADNLSSLNSLITYGIDWFALNIDSFSGAEPSYSGDYTTKERVASFDIDNGKINLVDSTGFSLGDNVCLYTPWANYNFLPGQESAGIVNTSGAASWRDYFNSAGPSWYDEDNERYVVLVNGRTSADDPQVGFAYSADLETWTMGNGDLPIIEKSDHVNFATFVMATGNALDIGGGKVAFSVWGRDGVGDNKINIVQMNKDCTGIVISDGVLDSVDAYSAGLSYYNGKYVLLVTNSAPAQLYDWTVEMWESDTLTSGYTKTTDVFTTEYNNNDSVWLEGHADSLTPFVENGKLYAMIAGTQRYIMSGILGNRVYGLMEYDGTDWVISNDFAPEIIHPMYFNGISGEDYAWASGHVGGYFSFIKKDGNTYAFASMLVTAHTYQVAGLQMTDYSDGVSMSTGIGSGEANTDLIVAQTGHISSAAQECLDHLVSTTETIGMSQIYILPTSITNEITVQYLKSPTTPKWDYEIEQGRPLYKPETSIDFMFDDVAFMEISKRVLEQVGLNVGKEELTQYAMASKMQ